MRRRGEVVETQAGGCSKEERKCTKEICLFPRDDPSDTVHAPQLGRVQGRGQVSRRTNDQGKNLFLQVASPPSTATARFLSWIFGATCFL